MIPIANAVVDDLTVMIVVFDAPFTDSTVTGARRPDAAARIAEIFHIPVLFDGLIQ